MDPADTKTSEEQPEAPEITKEEYLKWRTATFGDAYQIWRNGGFCLSTLTNLEGAERQKALAMLHKGLDWGYSDCVGPLAAMEGDIPLLHFPMEFKYLSKFQQAKPPFQQSSKHSQNQKAATKFPSRSL